MKVCLHLLAIRYVWFLEITKKIIINVKKNDFIIFKGHEQRLKKKRPTKEKKRKTLKDFSPNFFSYKGRWSLKKIYFIIINFIFLLTFSWIINKQQRNFINFSTNWKGELK